MMRLRNIFVLLCICSFSLLKAQELPVNYSLGENYNDRYKYSTILSIDDDQKGQTVIVRKYYGGVLLRAKGHYIEMYDADLNLIQDYNYKYSAMHMVDGFIRNGQLYLLELKYNNKKEGYEYIIHQTPLDDFNFTERSILFVSSKEVTNPLAVSKFNRSFNNGFSTAVHFNDKKNAFAITVQHREGKKKKYAMHLFGADLKKHITYDFSTAAEDKNYAFENIEVSPDFQALYFSGKAYFKKRRFDAKERRFQYEVVRVTNSGHQTQEFNDAGRYPESLKPILIDNSLVTVGFYADRKDNRYNGLCYYKLNASSLEIQSKKYNAFSEQFMVDKFGREVNAEIKNLIFKSIHVTEQNALIFSAEEYFVTKGMDATSTGTRLEVERFHYNDIVCAKLNSKGDMEWARNINKAEVTQGDAAYASYTPYGKGETMFFFINSGENPQKMSKNRILFKQGFSRNPNLFVIQVKPTGDLSYKKLVDDKDVRLPIMVSKPLIRKTDNELLFYAKRGSRKQLVKVTVN
ncbi:hypothetical protein [uncultured Maribacter sp.]|uniref:hypothetical protein n=1 Tax=uncultured Maribacter sp. TaxID=431308 RepID=UPI00260E0E72|nr:hypothetical protein [uncultured Maribacter sp.]